MGAVQLDGVGARLPHTHAALDEVLDDAQHLVVLKRTGRCHGQLGGLARGADGHAVLAQRRHALAAGVVDLYRKLGAGGLHGLCHLGKAGDGLVVVDEQVASVAAPVHAVDRADLGDD